MDDERVLASVRQLMALRVAELQQHLHTLVDKITVHDFHLVDGRVVWTANIPPTLLTLVRQLPDTLSPHE